jgi:hypothetical protein
MAKAQSFADKVKKKSEGPGIKVVKLVYYYKSADNGAWRSADKLVKIFPGEDENNKINSEIKSGKARLQKS